MQMHLGYHELRNMLSKFKEEREKRKASGGGTTGAPTAPGGPTAPSSAIGRGGGDYRTSSRDDYRDRDRDRDRGSYDRHASSRYEYAMILSISDMSLA